MSDTAWPALPYAAWKDSCDTLHLWMQIVGKVRLALTPWPDAALMAFLQTTYAAAADRGGWDRAALECPLG